MNKTSAIIIGSGIFILFLTLIFSGSKSINYNGSSNINNVEIRDGIQYVTINAKAGYSPRVSTAKAGIPTKLIIKTDHTFDCSSILNIRSISFQKALPQTGETIIDIGTPKYDNPLLGICGMGMYSFTVNFS